MGKPNGDWGYPYFETNPCASWYVYMEGEYEGYTLTHVSIPCMEHYGSWLCLFLLFWQHRQIFTPSHLHVLPSSHLHVLISPHLRLYFNPTSVWPFPFSLKLSISRSEAGPGLATRMEHVSWQEFSLSCQVGVAVNNLTMGPSNPSSGA